MNNASGHIAILVGAGLAAYALAALVYPARRTETASSAQSPVVVTLPQRADAPVAPKAVSPPRDRISLTRQLQSELRRVGCYAGEISGVWTPRTRMAMKAFTDRVNATLPTDAPDHILLALVQNHQGTACGTSCPAGQALGADGRCLPAPMLAKPGKKPEAPDAAAVEKPPAAPAIMPPIPAIAPKLQPPPASVAPSVAKPLPSPRMPSTARADPAPGSPQAREPGASMPPGERRRASRQSGPIPSVGIYERRLRRSVRRSRQLRYARSLLRSLQRAALAPWRLP